MGEIRLTDRERRVASEYHGGGGSMLYAVSSVGALRPGTLRRGGETSEDEHMRELAARLLSEAEEAAEIAADVRDTTAKERREKAADRRVLLRIADKARAFLQPAPKADRTRLAFGDKLAEISALREGVAEPFVPLFDHLIALARQSQSAGRAQRAGTEFAKARKIAAEHPRRAGGGSPPRAGGGEAPKKSVAPGDALRMISSRACPSNSTSKRRREWRPRITRSSASERSR